MWIGAIHVEDVSGLPVSLVETKAFSRYAKDIFNETELVELKMILACNPEIGVVLKGTGGVRKMRWTVHNKGKSNGARVIYFCGNDTMPIYLLAAYRKSEKIDISETEKRQMKNLVKALVKEHSRPDICA